MDKLKRSIGRYIIENIFSESENLKNVNSLYLKKIGEDKVLYSYDANRCYPVGSLVKLMTSIIILDSKMKLDKKVRVVKDVEYYTSSERMFRNVSLKEGDRVSVKDLLTQTISLSACDSSLALAKAYSGNNNFSDLMNKKAEVIGLVNYDFKDPVGSSIDNKISAKDVSIMAEYFVEKNRDLMDILIKDKVKHNGKTYDSTSPNFISPDSYIVKSIKTGFLDEAGRSIVVYIKNKKTKNEYILTVIGAKRMLYRDYFIKKLFNDYVVKDNIFKIEENNDKIDSRKLNKNIKLNIKI